MYSLWLVLSLLMANSAIAASSSYLESFTKGWETVSENDRDIKVMRKNSKNSPVMGFSGLTVFDSPIEKIIWTITASKYKPNWLDLMVSSEEIAREGQFERTYYEIYDQPWPVSDRDFVYSAKLKTTSGNTVIIDIKDATAHPNAPQESVGVRGFIHLTKWVLVPVAPNRTEVLLMVNVDPGGMIPSWLVNMIQESWPANTLSALREEVKKPYIQKLSIPAISLEN